ncbi:MAG TPA: hypothetical protein DCL21_02630 [Alphaproteobacteria bacterium]|nr:hypothetical protein [Alphaproteobacteria bacterium]
MLKLKTQPSEQTKEMFKQVFGHSLGNVAETGDIYKEDFKEGFSLNLSTKDILYLILAVTLIICTLIIFGSAGVFYGIILVSIVMAFMPSKLKKSKSSKKSANAYKMKNEFIKPLLKKAYGFTYPDNIKNVKLDFKYSAFYKILKRSVVEDYFYGKVDDNIHLEFIDFKRFGSSTISTSSRDKQTPYEATAVVLTMPFKFDSYTAITTKSSSLLTSNNILQLATKSLAMLVEKHLSVVIPEIKKKGAPKVNLDSQKLAEICNVYSDNVHDAYYLLSPAFIDRFIELKRYCMKTIIPGAENMPEAYGDSMIPAPIEMEFIGNKVVILFPVNYDFIDCVLESEDVSDAKAVVIIENQIALISNLVSQLKLDYLTDRKQAYNKIK